MKIAYKSLFTSQILQLANTIEKNSMIHFFEASDQLVQSMVIQNEPAMCSIYVQDNQIEQMHCTCEFFRPKQPCGHLAATLVKLNTLSDEELQANIEQNQNNLEEFSDEESDDDDFFDQFFADDDDVDDEDEDEDFDRGDLDMYELISECDDILLYRFLEDEFLLDESLFRRFVDVMMDEVPEAVSNFYLSKFDKFCYAMFDSQPRSDHDRMMDLGFDLNELFDKIRMMYLMGKTSEANDFLVETLKIFDGYALAYESPIYLLMLDRTHLFVKELAIVHALDQRNFDLVALKMIQDFPDANLKTTWTEWFSKLS